MLSPIHLFLVNLVLEGKKPSTMIRAKERPDYVTLDCEEVYFKHLLKPSAYTTYVLAPRNLHVVDLITQTDLVYPDYSLEIQNKVISLYAQIKEKNVAPALKLLLECPRIIGTFRGFEVNGLETAENAILTGRLFGYKPCDIDYYIKTRYFGEKEDELDKPENQDPNGFNVQCPSCIKERIKNLS